MADSTTKQRYISTSIWDDDWFWALDDQGQKLFFYLLTNERTNVAGIYEIALSRIAKDTRWEIETVKAVLATFEVAGKAFYRHGYVILPSWPHHQKWWSRSKIKLGIDAVLASIPDRVYQELGQNGIGYRYPIAESGYPIGETTPKPDTLPNDSDSDSDLDSSLERDDFDNDFETSDFESDPLPAVAGAEKPKSLAPLKEPLARLIDDSFLAIHEYTSIAKERGQVTQLARKCRARDPTEPEAVARRMLSAFSWLRKNAEPFWRKQPFTPSAMSSLWDRIEAEIESRMEAHAMSEGGREFLEGA